MVAATRRELTARVNGSISQCNPHDRVTVHPLISTCALLDTLVTVSPGITPLKSA